MAKKLTLTREKRELSVLHRPQVAEKRFCEVCRKDVRWLLPEEAMLLAEISLREIFKLVETQQIHFIESADGFLLVCAESLATQKKA